MSESESEAIGARAGSIGVARERGLLELEPDTIGEHLGKQASLSRLQMLRGLLGRVPRVVWMLALIAFLNAFAWSLIVPPFQGKDEADHFAYVSQIAQTGTLPKDGHELGVYSRMQTLVMEALHSESVVSTPFRPAISSVEEQHTLDEDLNSEASLRGSGEAGIATSEPPLYYALQVVPYEIASGNILDQLQLMRWFTALFGALTTVLVYLFIRETLPGQRWPAVVGALCIALQPLLAFMSGSVNPDAMLYTVSAGLFLCLARALRRGLTLRLAIVTGVLTAVGFLTKLNFVGLAIGVFAGLVVLAARGAKSRGWSGISSPAIAAGIGLSPGLLYVLHNAATGQPTFGILSGVGNLAAIGTLFHELTYAWQLYLPRLPGMPHYLEGITTYKDIWFDRLVGLYGWMDTMFPVWVDNVALIPFAAIVLLLGRELVIKRSALCARLPELGVYAAMVAGLLLVVGLSSYQSDITQHRYAFGEPRYLLPLLALAGVGLALAVRGAGRRWAPVVGAALVVVFLGHDIFSQLQVIARYYG